jgi:3-oxoacyl-[acyl-carrier protein] reductase
MKTSFVTGASSGIGAAIALRLLADGWVVHGASRRQPDIKHVNFHHLPIDLLEQDFQLPPLAPVDALIHAAGILRLGGIAAHNSSGAEMWQVHVNAAARLAQLLVPAMPDGGRIVLIGSRSSRGSANRPHYAASKAALTGLARSWAMELVPRRIAVNVISPAATDTAMQNDPARAAVKPKLPPFGALIDPTEIAALTAFLLSDAACNITGQEIFVCGGASL